MEAIVAVSQPSRAAGDRSRPTAGHRTPQRPVRPDAMNLPQVVGKGPVGEIVAEAGLLEEGNSHPDGKDREEKEMNGPARFHARFEMGEEFLRGRDC